MTFSFIENFIVAQNFTALWTGRRPIELNLVNKGLEEQFKLKFVNFVRSNDLVKTKQHNDLVKTKQSKDLVKNKTAQWSSENKTAQWYSENKSQWSSENKTAL